MAESVKAIMIDKKTWATQFGACQNETHFGLPQLFQSLIPASLNVEC
jgi:hypothetical protein